jgi:hypothetical protein
LTPRPASRKLPPGENRDPDCLRCRHHFITHEADWPHGCRAFEFKSRALPARVVRESSGAPCEAFEARPAPPEANRR